MTAVTPATSPDSGDLGSLGCKQELDRGLGPFASFASGFSFVSILTTVFRLFIVGFGFGGPAYIWTWSIVFVGQFCVCLVFAELSARYPIAGAIYQWSRRSPSRSMRCCPRCGAASSSSAPTPRA